MESSLNLRPRVAKSFIYYCECYRQLNLVIKRIYLSTSGLIENIEYEFVDSSL